MVLDLVVGGHQHRELVARQLAANRIRREHRQPRGVEHMGQRKQQPGWEVPAVAVQEPGRHRAADLVAPGSAWGLSEVDEHREGLLGAVRVQGPEVGLEAEGSSYHERVLHREAVQPAGHRERCRRGMKKELVR